MSMTTQPGSNGRLKTGPAPELVQSANQLELSYAPVLTIEQLANLIVQKAK